jgi:hypothetical protein
MAKNKIRDDVDFSEETVKRRRTFPKGKTILLCVLVVIQIVLVLVCMLYDPQPQDVIDEYLLTVSPREDGSLDVKYEFVWTPLDESEPLTWVEIGMANEAYAVIEDSLSANIRSVQKHVEDGYVSLRVYFHTPYIAGETLSFSFTVNQHSMLCKDVKGYFYEWVPGWFNYTPVKYYCVKWLRGAEITDANYESCDKDYLVWTGEMPCGTYVKTIVKYAPNAFEGAKTVPYEPFYEGDVIDGLKDDQIAVRVMCVIFILGILVAEVWILDCYVSYHRGRGFMRGYGYHVHVYGRSNPHYVSARGEHVAKNGGRGGRGGGCACACACACAGGGRAGCSQKDTTALRVSDGDSYRHQ